MYMQICMQLMYVHTYIHCDVTVTACTATVHTFTSCFCIIPFSSDAVVYCFTYQCVALITLGKYYILNGNVNYYLQFCISHSAK